MGEWSVDTTSEPGILRLRLVGTLTEEEMRAFVAAHNEAIDRLEGADYRVWCDVSELNPLSMEQAALFESAKRHSASKPNFRGSAVKVSSALIALQHRRTSTESGVMSTELISSDEDALRAHLKRVHRTKPVASPPRRPPDKR